MHRILFVAFLTAAILALAWVWRLVAPASVTDKIALLNLFAVVGTALAVIWYSWETRKLRQVTHRQASLQIRPFLSLQYDPEERRLWIHNIGKGVVRDILTQDVRIAEEPDNPDGYLTVGWQPIDFILEGARRELIGEGQLIRLEEKQEISSKLRGWMSNFGPRGKADYEFVIDYHDLVGSPYRAAFSVSKGRAVLIRDEEGIAR